MNRDAKDACISRLEKENAALRERVEELERLLGVNSRNSSRPPSSDGPNAPSRDGSSGSTQPAKRRRRKRGARKGHEPHLRELLPPEKVTKRIQFTPRECICGGRCLEPCDQEPRRHQTVDIPPIVPDVTEYVQHVRRCKDCGEFVYAPLPDEVKRTHFGPGVLALVAILTGVLNTSKRKALAMMNEVFGVPMSLGGLSNCESRISDILSGPYDETLEHVRGQDVAHADETGWRRGNRKRGWLWTLCGRPAAVFMVHAKRGRLAARKLLGEFHGTLISDRWCGYSHYAGIRQICWAHLQRDFTAISETNGKLGRIGEELYGLAKRILRLRRRVRDGTLQWRTFQRRMIPLMSRVDDLLARGAARAGPMSGKCRDILKHREHLWTFVSDQSVEPTNNTAERTVRQGVLWRKMSFGTQSERGARYVERILTVCATCRLQGRSVIEYLRNACRCHLDGIHAPPLITPVGN